MLDEADAIADDAEHDLDVRPPRRGRGHEIFRGYRGRRRGRVGRHTFSADEIKAFAAPLRSAAVPSSTRRRRQRSHFGALVRLRLAYRGGLDAADGRSSPPHGEAARARGEPVAAMGPALGFRELKWLKPVYAGDTIDYASEVIEARVPTAGPVSA